MELRVRPTPTRFPTNSLYTPVDKHTLAFYIKCVPPMGCVAVVVEASAPKIYSRVTLASASTLSGSVVRTLSGLAVGANCE